VAGELLVGVNLLWCRPGRVGGAEEYLVRQLRGLRRTAPEVRARLAVPPGFARAHPDLIAQYPSVRSHRLSSTLPGRLLEEARWLPARMSGVDVMHHANGTVPPRSSNPVVLTVHDLQYREYPHYFSPLRRSYLRWRIPPSVRAAAVVTVPSEFVKRSVVDAFGVDYDRVRVVPHAFEPLPAVEWSEADLRQRYELGTARILAYPAATFPHKRHDFLLDLVAGPLRGEEIVLVFMGGRGRAEKAVAEEIGRRGLASRVVRTGRVPEADRDGLISIAEVVVFPSEYEGFGAPVLEAMALGTPVICSDRAALPEVVGDAALVTPLDLDAWSAALRDASRRHDELVSRGRARAERFSLAASGAALAAAYRSAAGLSDREATGRLAPS
jgi:alpha-1,3-rhamnosyl/mannosyltransferase